jgi:hypothetical protein
MASKRALVVDRSSDLNGQVSIDARELNGARAGSPVASKKSRARPGPTQAPDAGLALEPHVCRHCFGRLASEPGEDGHRRYQCTNCGASAAGATPAVLCACGLTFRRHGRADQPQDAGLRCQQNPSPTPEFPSLFVAVEQKS